MSHIEKHFTGSELIRDIVIGMSDGLTVPFALAAGLSGAVDSNKIIVTAGLAEIIAGSIAMGLGGYLAGKTDFDHYYSELKREYFETEKFPEKEKEEVREILGEYGVSEAGQVAVANELAQNKDNWVRFMMRFELGLEEPHLNRARNSAITIASSYVVGGLIPLSPYIIVSSAGEALIGSVVITLLALFIFGYIKSRVTGQSPFAGAVKTTLIGAVAATAAYLMATWIG